MKRLSLSIVFACCALAMSAQDAIRVKYQGAKPSIVDFAKAFFASYEEDEECGVEAINAFNSAFRLYLDGKSQDEGERFTVDEKNGYISYEWTEEGHANFTGKMEMCYWNESDGKHKLFVYNNLASIIDSKPLLTESSDIQFYRYNNATKKMVPCDAPGFEVTYSDTSYSMPRVGKDITVTKWNDNGTKTQTTLKWNGRRFSY